MHKKRLFALALSFGLSNMLSAYAAGTLYFDNGTEPPTLDPQLASDRSAGQILNDTFEGLTTHGPEGGIVPGIAKSWETSDDGLTWTFHLRDSQWSDGTPLTAADFVYGWQRAVNPQTGATYAFILFPVKNARAIANGNITDVNQLGVKAIDDYTLQVELENPTPYLAQLLPIYTAFPAPRHIIEQYGNEWTRPEHVVSNGPFHLSKWTPQANITVTKSDTYWDKENVSLDSIVYYPIEDPATALARYRAGELDIANVPIDQLEWAKKHLADELHINEILRTSFYGFNLNKAPYKDNPKLRRALAMAIDRNILTEKVLHAGEIPAYNLVSPHTANYEPYLPEWANWPREKQIAEARRLYAEAGYSKDNPFTPEVLYDTSDDNKKIAIAIASMWKQVLGIETQLINQEWKVMLSNIRQGNADLFRVAWRADYNDPNAFLAIFQSDSGENLIGYNNPEYDQLLDAISREGDLGKRAGIIHNATQILTDDDALIPIYYFTEVKLIKPEIKGVHISIEGITPSRYLSKEE